ncbi:ATP synthase E chain-domain-containing protein [Leucosporidium creatinivorum]|uniref:ATP synthase F(0) complex subunit e, mitochondrial n=1 Tax=Leucosporidium creatinivorum TaxID=106004 RepID=A0A1Y2FEQ8_9BASI|nr:ATP synthase E chain-domain-containing protein [Leucosporidium creatinivorum]
MVSPAVNVVRYSALVSGIFYGIFHRQTLQAKFDANAASQEVHKREQWLAEAKKAWAAKTAKNDGLITDPDAPGFDLEKVLLSLEK